jgi:hypothetical protein
VGQTLAAGVQWVNAGVSTLLRWEELDEAIQPQDFTMITIHERVSEKEICGRGLKIHPARERPCLNGYLAIINAAVRCWVHFSILPSAEPEGHEVGGQFPDRHIPEDP